MKKICTALLILLALALPCLLSCSEQQSTGEHTHNYIERVILPTCLEKGYTNRVCKDCGETTNYNFTTVGECVPSENWTVTKEATCSKTGEKQKNCITCGRVLQKEAIELAEHQGITTVTRTPSCLDTGVNTTSCNVCGITISTEVIEKTDAHDFELYTTPPTETALGSTTYKCKVCNHTEQGDYVEIKSGLSASEIYEKASKATVRVEAYDKGGKRFSIGTGFFYASDGKLITNYHVVSGAYSLKVVFYDGTKCDVTHILGFNKKEDVAIVKVDVENEHFLELASDGEKVKTGDTVYALGNPLGVNNIFSAGIVSNPSITLSGMECIAFTAPISPGNSGGPLLNSNGKVVGVNSMYIPDAQNLNFAILIDKAINLSLSSPVTSQALYMSTLNENSYDVLASYIVNNHDGMSEDVYVMLFEEPETYNTAGFEYAYVYDSATGEIFIEVAVISKGQIQYVMDFYLSAENGGANYVSLYDISANQTTIEAYVNVSRSLSDASSVNYVEFRYNSLDVQNTEVMQGFFVSLFDLLIEHFKNTLANSYTGLTISSFGFHSSYLQ